MTTDNFAQHASGLSSPPRRHFQITPSDSADLPIRPRAIYCNAAGNAVIRDETGADITYAVNVGLLPFRAVRVLATGTTATEMDMTPGSGTIFGNPTGGVKGAGTINVQNGYYANGSAGLTTTVAVPCGTLTFTQGLLTSKGAC